MENIQTKAINAIRMLSADAVQKAKSGHPGLPMGSAPLAYALWGNIMVHNPKNPNFPNRDRFVLSAGHGSMLLYSLLHLFGYGLTIEDLQNFRQFGSRTPGHPEFGHTVGVETTTGPLGQGFANGVGMAIAESHLASIFNREDFPLVDHYTYVLVGDGCMMEGITNEAASLAGTLALGKLIVLYDDNDISIEGSTDISFRENVGKRFEALGWNVQRVDGNDPLAVTSALKKAKKKPDKPNLIVCRTTIGFGSPLEGKESCHGAPLGEDNLLKTRQNLGWEYPAFVVPQEIRDHYSDLARKGARAEAKWKRLYKSYQIRFPELEAQYREWMTGKMPDLEKMEDLWKFDKPEATRNTSELVLNKLAKLVPNLIGGSADLSPSNKSYMKGRGDFSAEDRQGANMHFGIREHAMSAITNGMQIHGGLRAYCATFFVFSDYMKNGIRMSAIMNLQVPYILTHDGIGVGEDGPTHQPVEHLTGLRAIPNLKVFRPADGKETTAAWITALRTNGPTCLVLSRQNLPQYETSGPAAFKGGYVLQDSQKKTPDIILIATGSEVALAVEAKKTLAQDGIDARVVSMPCQELFDIQSPAYRETVLPSGVRRRISIEAGSTLGWYKYIGLEGTAIGIDTFGLSAPYQALYTHFGITADRIVREAKKMVSR
jgi:transketolase